jgi:hypothetical protein
MNLGWGVRYRQFKHLQTTPVAHVNVRGDWMGPLHGTLYHNCTTFLLLLIFSPLA